MAQGRLQACPSLLLLSQLLLQPPHLSLLLLQLHIQLVSLAPDSGVRGVSHLPAPGQWALPFLLSPPTGALIQPQASACLTEEASGPL